MVFVMGEEKANKIGVSQGRIAQIIKNIKSD
jgi:hypothetical protein